MEQNRREPLCVDRTERRKPLRDELGSAGAPKVKICGLTSYEDIEYVNRSCPDFIGFVFAEKSRRFIPYEKAAQLKARLHPSIQAVGVFVDEDPERIAGLLQAQVIDLAQLHGREDALYIAELRRLTRRPLIQAFQVSDREDFCKAQESTADYLLLDSPQAGSGTVFDWSLLRDIRRPYFLAGGLNPDNIEEAIKRTHPFGVDVSSGVETDRSKDKEKIDQFVKTVRDLNGKDYKYDK